MWNAWRRIFAVSVLVGRPQVKRLLRRPKPICENTIKMDSGEIVWEGMDSTDMADDRNKWRAFVNTVMSRRVT